MNSRAERAETFRVLHDAIYADLVRFIQRRVAPDDVDDVISEVLAVWWRRFDDCPRGLSQVRAWVFTAARQLLQNHYRTTRRRSALAVRIASATSAQASAPAADTAIDRIDLAAAWRQLPPAQQEALALVVFEELDAGTAAKVAGVGPGTLRMRLSRARRALRHHLTPASAAHPEWRPERTPSS